MCRDIANQIAGVAREIEGRRANAKPQPKSEP
jgi:hypothetical protein